MFISYDELIKDLIGYDPEKYIKKILLKLNKDGQIEKVILIKVKVMMHLLNIEDKPVILSSHGICYRIIIFCFEV